MVHSCSCYSSTPLSKKPIVACISREVANTQTSTHHTYFTIPISPPSEPPTSKTPHSSPLQKRKKSRDLVLPRDYDPHLPYIHSITPHSLAPPECPIHSAGRYTNDTKQVRVNPPFPKPRVVITGIPPSPTQPSNSPGQYSTSTMLLTDGWMDGSTVHFLQYSYLLSAECPPAC